MTASLFNNQNGSFGNVVDGFVYPQFIGYALRAPTTQDIYNPGTRWQDNSVNPPVIYETTGAGVWHSESGDINAVNGTTNQITASTTAEVVTLSIPTTFIAPGSIASTTTLTGGTGITATTGNIVASAGNISATVGSITAGTTVTATLGNITATNGNFVSSAAGKGLQFNANANSGAAASPVVLDSRAGQVTFTSVSIAAAADLTLTITNSAITSSSTQVIYSMSGATTGAALSIKSVTNTSGSSAIVVTNGTGATTSTADIVINFIVVN